MAEAEKLIAAVPSALRVVVMGVSGSGKSTIGARLADRLEVAYADADDFHSEASRAKLRAGDQLTDEDRLPWLRSIGAWLERHSRVGGVVSCSALKRSYRDLLRTAAPDLTLLYCEGSPALIRSRLAGRSDHFMAESLLDSQFAELEPPGDDERAITIDVSQPPEQLVESVVSALRAAGRLSA